MKTKDVSPKMPSKAKLATYMYGARVIFVIGVLAAIVMFIVLVDSASSPKASATMAGLGLSGLLLACLVAILGYFLDIWATRRFRRYFPG